MYKSINTIINEIDNDGSFSLTASNNEFLNDIRKLESQNIITKKGSMYIFTDIGYHIVEVGGYEQYLLELKEKASRELEIHNATIKSSEATVSAADSAKISKNWAIITGTVGIFSFAWAIYQTILTNEINENVDRYDHRLKQQDSIIEIQHQQLTKFGLLLNQRQPKK